MAAGESAIDGYLDAADTRSTLDAMRAVGADVTGVEVSTRDERTIPGVGGPPSRRIAVRSAESLASLPVAVPGDFSSAAFFIVAACLVSGSELVVDDVGLSPTRIGLLGVLNRMGA